MRRWHSASGLFPLGAYLLFHAWEHWPVQSGRDPLFERLARSHDATLEIAFVLLPLAVHALLGLWLARGSDGAPSAYASRAFRRLQLATGLLAAAFVAVHVAAVWWPRLREPTPLAASYGAVRDQAGTLPGLALYVLGIGAVCTHFGQGLAAALIRLSEGAVSPRLARALGVVAGLGLWLAFLNVLAVYATGARLL